MCCYAAKEKLWHFPSQDVENVIRNQQQVMSRYPLTRRTTVPDDLLSEF